MINAINKRASRLIIFTLTTYCALNSSISADEVRLESGDHLIGKVEEVNKEFIVMTTSFSERLKLKHELIAEIRTLQPINIVFENGEVIMSTLSKTKNSQISYQKGDRLIPIDVIGLAESPNMVLAKNAKRQQRIKYSGKLDIGLSRSSGNEDDEDYHGALKSKARTINNRYTLEASKTIEKNNGDKTQDETFFSLQWDHFVNKKWYAFTSASFEEDLEEMLELRSTYSVGSGYQFFEHEDLSLNTELGLAYVDEEFDEDDMQYAGGRWAIDYEHMWFEWLGAFHNQEGFFSLEDSDNINIRSSSGFRFPVSDHISASLKANIDWNRAPAEGATGTDKEYIFTLGYEY